MELFTKIANIVDMKPLNILAKRFTLDICFQNEALQADPRQFISSHENK